jgi:nitrogen fixation/metabolism regulation signal transduction histidine kinase
MIGKGKGYLNMASPQYRFIVFLLIILGAYTFLLKVFQKLAEFVQFPVFLPIALISLLIFIGIAGSTYSHTIVGPLLRIRGALDRLAEGDMNISLRLRESDDPMLKDIVKTLNTLKEHTRNSHALIQESARDLLKDAVALGEMAQRGVDKAEMQKQIDGLRKKQDVLDKAIKSLGKS